MIRTRAITYQNILSDASNLAYFAGRLLNQANQQVQQCSTAAEHD